MMMTGWCNTPARNTLFLRGTGLDDGTAAQCLAGLGSDSVTLALLPLVVLLLGTLVPALIGDRRTRRSPHSDVMERAPLLGDEVAGQDHDQVALSEAEREWTEDAASGMHSQAPSLGLNPLVLAGHLVSVLLVAAAAQWELVNELSDNALSTQIASWLFVIQMVIALLLFAAFAKDPASAASTILLQFAKRRNKIILMRLAVFHLLSASVWTFVIMAAWPIWKEGKVSDYFFSLSVAMLLAGYVMALICLTVRGRIKTNRIHRVRVDGKIPCPELDAGLLSRLTFSWFDPLMSQGYRKDLVLEDLYDLNPSEQINTNMTAYRHIQIRSPTPLVKTIWLMNLRALVFQFLLVLANTILYFSGPFFLNRILSHITRRSSPVGAAEPEWMAYLYVVGIVVSALTRFALDGQINLSARKIGIRVRNTLSGLIYEKSLKRVPRVAIQVKVGDDPNAAAGASVGKIVNLMSVDASSVGDWIGVIYTPFITLVQIILCILSLLSVLGWPALSGVVMMVLLMFSGAPLANSIKNAFAAVKRTKDARVNAMNEALQGIKIVKLFAWEKQVARKLTLLREAEMDTLLHTTVLMALNRVLWVSAPILTTFVTLGTYTKVAGRPLDATTAFTALALFGLLRNPLQQFPDTLVNLLDVWVSIGRIKTFLLEDELERFEGGVEDQEVHRMGLKEATFEWPEGDTKGSGNASVNGSLMKRMWNLLFFRSNAALEGAILRNAALESSAFKLADVSVEFPPSKLTVVVGATGSGKTSLILSLLGETTRLSGTRLCPSSVAYVSQSAWLTNATIRENILFGTEWDPVRYRRVVQACALVKDFELLEGSDLTEVGEQGVNLSGGQKQRISLARAAYSRNQFVIFDDPLSAVDAPTARHLFEHCIIGLLAGRTRILVTNAVGLAMPCADHLVLMNAGRLSSQGTVEEVMKFISTRSAEFAATPFSMDLADMTPLVLSERSKFLDSENLAASVNFLETLDGDESAPKYTTESAGVGSKLTDTERVESGNVKLAVYGLYLWATGGIPFLLLLLGGYSLNHGLVVLQDFVVSWWSSKYKEMPSMSMFGFLSNTPAVEVVPASFVFTWTHGNETSPGDMDSITNYYLTMYGIVGACCMLAILGRLLILAYGTVRAAKEIHRAMLERIMRTPLRFFEVTPLGRIMNRFTKDMGSVDREVGASAGNTVYNLVAVSFIIGSVASVIPGLLLLLLPIAYCYYRVGMFYIRTSRSLKRIDSVVRSPIFSHFSETLNGVTTIRAFNSLSRFSQESFRRFDVSNRASYFLIVSNLWLSIRIQSLSALIIGCAATLVVATGVGAGLAGLCLNLTLSVTDNLIALVRMQSWLEMVMNSIERCDEYIHLDSEAADVIPDKRPPQSWPTEGRVSIRNLEMRYSPESPLVLHGISAEIEAREKVGIVGRTGAGKSTLTLAFFRIVEPSGGSIVIDGVDTGKIGLDDLRSNLTIIPQDPVLFAGTVRSNMDPFGNIPDDILLNALHRSHLVSSNGKPAVLEHTNSSATLVMDEEENDESSTRTAEPEFTFTLDSPISEGGSNLSAGQRQLLCLARALAKGSKVILLDEATASVDSETDGRIQATIRSEFTDSTVLTIAHRLKTIVDYDRVIVLDHGVIVENGRPIDLIENSKVNAFRRMCEETGEFEDLVAIARASALVK